MLNRILLIIATILLTTSSFASADGFEKIHKVNMSKDQIHNAVIEWIATTFNDPSSVIKVNDKAGGKIIVKGLAETEVPDNDGGTLTFKYKYTTVVDIKKNKYKIKYSDYYLHDIVIDPITKERGDFPVVDGGTVEDGINLFLNGMDNHLLLFIKQYKKKANW